jgi:uracil-DNA glycosylase
MVIAAFNAVLFFLKPFKYLMQERIRNSFYNYLHLKPGQMNVKIEASWKKVLKEEFNKTYFKQVTAHIKTEREQGKNLYPPGSQIFNAFDKTPFDKVKVVILGQDPYHGAGQAMGLCFSVPKGIPPPPSLINIFKELKEDTGMAVPNHGDLSSWADEGVLLLNASLTVRSGEPMSHSKIGWQVFTDQVIQKISDLKQHVVFILWGKFAQEKASLIQVNKHCILKAPHPSPLSAHSGFLGCRHFSKTNHYLMKTNQDPVNWSL